MSKKTQAEIDTEIAALEACKAWAPKKSTFGDDNHAAIDLQIEFLKGQIDTTAEEFNEMDMDSQDAVLEAERWQDGEEPEGSPSMSQGWDAFKPEAKD